MYKRAAKLWSGIRNLAGKFGPPSKSGLAFKVGRRTAKAGQSKQAAPCRICGDSIAESVVSDHLFFVHRLATCKYCKEPIDTQALYKHIETKHGKKIFETWLANKPKKSKGKKKLDVMKKAGKKTRESNHPLGETVKCEFCNLMVDVGLRSTHLERYCKNSNQRPKRLP